MYHMCSETTQILQMTYSCMEYIHRVYCPFWVTAGRWHVTSGYDCQLPSLFKGGQVSIATPTHEWFVKSYQKHPSKLSPSIHLLEKKNKLSLGAQKDKPDITKARYLNVRLHVMSPESHPRSRSGPLSPPSWSLPPLPWRYQGHVNTSTRLCCHLWYLGFVMYVWEM